MGCISSKSVDGTNKKKSSNFIKKKISPQNVANSNKPKSAPDEMNLGKKSGKRVSFDEKDYFYDENSIIRNHPPRQYAIRRETNERIKRIFEQEQANLHSSPRPRQLPPINLNKTHTEIKEMVHQQVAIEIKKEKVLNSADERRRRRLERTGKMILKVKIDYFSDQPIKATGNRNKLR